MLRNFLINHKKKIIFILILFVNVSLDLVIKKKIENSLIKPYQVNQQNKIINLEVNEYITRYPEKGGEYSTFVGREVIVIDNFWNLYYTRNYNIGFSFLRFLEKYFSPENISFYLQFVQLLGIFLILLYFYSYNFKYAIAFNLILSGGLGNVIDRFYRGYVVDYMKWYIPDSSISILNPWPIFNLADVFVTIGGISLIINLIIISIKNKNAKDIDNEVKI